ncbi:MAG: 1,4-beta-xylanase, partial [Cellvibrio sp.]|nr:1,4-beta-xylanase [Cellvibrio sp.]
MHKYSEVPLLQILKRTCCSIGIGAALIISSHSASAACTYSIDNEWNTGFVASITIKNDTGAPINGWNINWSYSTNRITSSWNANLSGSNPYTATNIGWNGNIAVGQSVSFGFQGNKNGATAERPTVNGVACGGGTTSSVAPPSSTPSSIPRSSSAPSSVVPSSVAPSSVAVTSSSRSSAAPTTRKFVGNITTSGAVRSDFINYWNQITPENEGKWGSVEGTRDQYNWAPLDRIYAYAREHNIPVKAHTLVWGSQFPNWITNLSAAEQA